MRVAELRKEIAKTMSKQIRYQSPLSDWRIKDSYESRVGIENIEGNQILTPFIERLPIYKSFAGNDGFKNMRDSYYKDDEKTEDDKKNWSDFIDFIEDLGPDKGIFNPYHHQEESLRNWWEGKDVVVSTGTGSGKTECFLLPLLGHLWNARRRNQANQRGVKAIVLYPMNALATDQLKRVRKLFGDEEVIEKLTRDSRNPGDVMKRIFQFMLYTGRTNSHGPSHIVYENTNKKGEKYDAVTHWNLSPDRTPFNYMQVLEAMQENELTGINNPDGLFWKLYEDGFLPRTGKIASTPEGRKYRDYSGRSNMGDPHRLTTMSPEDAELVFRHEAHNVGYKVIANGDLKSKISEHYGGIPDLLITNYSMLDYMLQRPIEESFWVETKKWLDADDENKLLFVMDEAHLYDGMLGVQISHLLRRMYLSLGLDSPEKLSKNIQFILTSASLGTEGETDAKKNFHQKLTSRPENHPTFFCDGKTWIPESEDNLFDEMILKNDFLDSLRSLEDSETTDGIRREILNLLNNNSNLEEKSLEKWFKIIRSSSFFSKFYENTSVPIRMDELEKILFPNNEDENYLLTQSILDLFTVLQGPHPGTGEISPMTSIRSHIMTRGLPRLHLQVDENGDNWQIIDGPNPIIRWDDEKNYSLNPFLLLGCRSCGGTYIRIWVNIYQQISADSPQVGITDVLEAWLPGDEDGAKNWSSGIVYDTRDGNNGDNIGLDLYLLERDNDQYFFRGSSKDDEKRFIDRPDGYIDPQNMKIYPYIKNRTPVDGRIPFLLPHKSDNITPTLVDPENTIIQDEDNGNNITFNNGSSCVVCARQMSSESSRDQIVTYETRGDDIFAHLTNKLLSLQKENKAIRQPNQGRKVLAFSDSVQRAAKLAGAIQRVSNLDQFRKILLSLINHPWYNQLEDEDRSIARLYPYFLLHSAALGKEPIEHKPLEFQDTGTFAQHRSKAISAALFSLLRSVDEFSEHPISHQEPFLESLSIKHDTKNFSLKEYLAKSFNSMNGELTTSQLDQMFEDFLWAKLLTRGDVQRQIYPTDMQKSNKNSKLNERSNDSTAWNVAYSVEYSEIKDQIIDFIKKERQKKDCSFKSHSLTHRKMFTRYLRYKITEAEIDEDDKEFCNSIDTKRKKEPNLGTRLLDKLIPCLNKKCMDEHSDDEWEKEIKLFAPYYIINSKILNLDPLHLSDISSSIIYYLDSIEKSNLEVVLYNFRTLTKPKLLRPTKAFVGTIVRLLSHNFLSLDQLGLGYVTLTEESWNEINNDLTKKFEIEGIEGVKFKRLAGKLGITKTGLDSNDEYVKRLREIVDSLVQIMSRYGNAKMRDRGAASFSLLDYKNGWTKTNIMSDMPFIKWRSNKEVIRDIIKKISDENYMSFVYKYIIETETLFKPASPYSGIPGNPWTLPVNKIKINGADLDNLLTCSRCSRVHPHPSDRLGNKCRWCNDEKLRKFDKSNHPVDEQRIYRPWHESLEEINLGKKELPDSGLMIVRAEEHTSQIGDHIKEGELIPTGIKFELLFQDIPFVLPNRYGNSPPEPVIDILSCTTTMEVGIDIGSLVAVGLRTLPPNASSYQQRVGRAGRKASEVCVALSWFDNTQYAQGFWWEPEKLLKHSKDPPIMYESSKHTTIQHLCLAILSEFSKTSGDFNEDTRIRDNIDARTNLMESHGSMENFFPGEFKRYKNWQENELPKEKLKIVCPHYFNDQEKNECIEKAKKKLLEKLTNLSKEVEK